MQIRGDLGLNALELLPAFGIYQRHDHFEIRVGLTQDLRRFKEICAEHFHFCPTTTRQQGQTVHVMRNAKHVARRIFIGVQRHGISHCVTDKAARHVEFIVKRFFERQEGQHQIRRSAYFENAFLSPRPDGRTDVMNGFDPLLFQIPFEGNIEIRRINADENIGLKFGKTAC